MLLDFAKGQKSAVDKLKKSSLLQQGHVLLATDFLAQAEADTEDLFGVPLYLEMVNVAFNVPAERIPEGVAGHAKNTPRVLEKVEEAFRLLPELTEFNHYTPASWLIENPAILRQQTEDVAAMLDRFEALFKKLNSLLT